MEDAARPPEESPEDPNAPGAPGVPGDYDTTTAVLTAMAADGMDVTFVPGVSAGSLRCGKCGSEVAGESLEVIEERRLEGASDPDDMVLIVAVRCPVCAAQGAVVLGYGAESSPEDTDLLLALRR